MRWWLCSRPSPGTSTACRATGRPAFSSMCVVSRFRPNVVSRCARRPRRFSRPAHAAKGLEWDVVAVTGVHEGVWPDLRVRGGLLGTETFVDIVAGRPDSPRRDRARLAEERRLFYVATSRARRTLVVTAVADEDTHPPASSTISTCPRALGHRPTDRAGAPRVRPAVGRRRTPSRRVRPRARFSPGGGGRRGSWHGCRRPVSAAPPRVSGTARDGVRLGPVARSG